jgi:hypothetical protein
MRLEADQPELEPAPPQRPRGPLPELGNRISVLRSSVSLLRDNAVAMFRPVRPSPISRISVLATGVAALAVAGYSLLRVGGAGAFNTIWAEDGANFLSDAYLLPAAGNILKPINGYFVVLPRLISEFASVFPVAWAPGVLSGVAALYSGGIAVLVYVASGNVLVRPFLRAVAALWIVAAPLAESTLTFGPNMVAPLQFVELYGLFWALFWTPGRTLGRVVQVAFVVLCCVSTFLAVFLLPVAVLRLWAVRDRWSSLLFGLILAGGAFQTSGIVLGLTSRTGISYPRVDPLWAFASYLGWGLPFGLFGEKILSDAGFTRPGIHSGGGGFWYWSAVIVTWLVATAVILAAARRLTRPHWLFATLALTESVLLLCGQIMVQGRLELRYAYTPSLLAVAGLLALLRPLPVSRHSSLAAWFGMWLPAMGLTFVLALSAAVNYRVETPRSVAIPWTVQVEQSAQQCRANRALPFVLTYSVLQWFVILPCRRLR